MLWAVLDVNILLCDDAKEKICQIKSYEDWCEPRLVSNALELKNSAYEKILNQVPFFTTDPFMYNYPEITEMSIEIIKKINAEGIKCTALTKGILPKGLADLSKENEYGITLISLDEDFRKEMEPNAAPYAERIAALRQLHDLGSKTWVSIEPYPTPNIVEQDFNSILEAVSFVDKIIFGRLNYNSKVSEYKNYKEFFNDLAHQTIKFCKSNNKECHIKEGTMS